MKRILFIFFIALSFFGKSVPSYAYTAAYLGWENFSSPVLPENSKANSLVFGVIGNTPTRIYFYYNVLGKSVYSSGEVSGMLGFGLDIAGGIGYRFMNAAYKRSGFDIGMDFYTFFAPYFLNSKTGYTETAIYYGIGLGLNTVYKINPYIGTGFRVSIKYTIGNVYLASKIPSSMSFEGNVGFLLTF